MVLMMGMETSAWIWKKRNFSASQHDSWQKQSFAQVSSELLCERICPPRFYSCSFCRKEFKSAQALGGHMNVHRRDRARLRKSPNSQSEVNQPSCGFLDAHQHPPGVCSMVILNTNSWPDHSSPEIDPNPQSHGATVSSATNSCRIDGRKHTYSQRASYQEPPLCDPRSNISCEFNLSAAGDIKSRNNLNYDHPWLELAIGSPDWLLGRKILDEGLLGSCGDEATATAKWKRLRHCSTGASGLYSRESASGLLGRSQSIIEDLDLELRLGVSSQVK